MSSSNLLPINLKFDGYYWPDASEIPEKPGIYCVYSTKSNPSGNMGVDELIYIGQAGNGDSSTLRSRIRNHAVTDYKDTEYADQRKGKNYAYSFTIISVKDIIDPLDHHHILNSLDLVEAALVFQFNPRNNKKLTTKYEGPDVEVTIKGKFHGMQDFRLYKGTERF